MQPIGSSEYFEPIPTISTSGAPELDFSMKAPRNPLIEALEEKLDKLKTSMISPEMEQTLAHLDVSPRSLLERILKIGNSDHSPEAELEEFGKDYYNYESQAIPTIVEGVTIKELTTKGLLRWILNQSLIGVSYWTGIIYGAEFFLSNPNLTNWAGVDISNAVPRFFRYITSNLFEHSKKDLSGSQTDPQISSLERLSTIGQQKGYFKWALIDDCAISFSRGASEVANSVINLVLVKQLVGYCVDKIIPQLFS